MHTPSRPATPDPAHAAATRAGALQALFFDDIDAQAASLHGWNQNYVQLSSGAFKGSVQRLRLPGVGLFIEDLHQTVHQTGLVRTDVVAIGIPLLFSGDSRFCGQVGSGEELHVFSGAQGFEFHSPRRHVMLGMEIDRALFDSLAVDDFDPATIRPVQSGLSEVDANAADALRAFALSLFKTALPGPSPLDAGASTELARDILLERIMAVMASCMPAADDCPGAASVRHAALERRARELAMSRLDEPPTVSELCALLGVSRRTLQACFQNTWGMGPLAWLNTLRLNAVRRRLKTAASVTEAATEFGFWHFGHFSSGYQSLFGELPSTTLSRYRPGLMH
jgi:AraC family ethanolamine operon transcriptional activator